MKKVGYILGSVTTLATPMLAFAQLETGNAGRAGDLLTGILDIINNLIIPAILAIGFLVFVWGMFQFFIAGGANDEKKEKGKSLMIYATLGFVLIIVFWGVVNLLTDSTGLEGESVTNTPTIIVP